MTTQVTSPRNGRLMCPSLVDRLIKQRNDRLQYFLRLADPELLEIRNADVMSLEDLIAEAERRRAIEITSDGLAERIAARLRQDRHISVRALALEFRPELEALGKVRPTSRGETVTRRLREFMSKEVRPLMAEFEWSPESRRGRKTGGLRRH